MKYEGEREGKKANSTRKGRKPGEGSVQCFYCRLLVQEQGTDQSELSEN